MRENFFELSRNKNLNCYFTNYFKKKNNKKNDLGDKKMNYNNNGNENN